MREHMKDGFTLIELALSMTFISILSIIVVVMIGNAVSAYHKGLTMNQINTTGMELVEDMRIAVQNSPGTYPANECKLIYSSSNVTAQNNCESDNAKGFVFKEAGKVTVKSTVDSGFETSVSPYGVFCTGKYSYLWNSGYLFNTDEYTVNGKKNGMENGIKLKYKKDNQPYTVEDIKLVKVQDEERLVCKIASGYQVGSENNYSGGSYSGTFVNLTNNTIDITSINANEDAIDLLEGNTSLRMYDLKSSLPATNGISNSLFYSVSFILGTMRGGVDASETAINCKSPEEDTALEDFDYCAINNFNFAATANGE